MRASKAMQHRVEKTENIKVLYNTEVEEVLGDQVVEGVRVFNNQTGDKQEIPVTGMFVAIGHKPNTDIFEGIIDMNDTGYIETQENHKDQFPGVFAAGDVQDHEYRQAITVMEQDVWLP